MQTMLARRLLGVCARQSDPDAEDDHFWSLVQSEEGSVLLMIEHALTQSPPPKSSVLQPREFAALCQD